MARGDVGESEPQDDEELARLAKSGDRQARNRLYFRHEARIRQLVAPARRYAALMAAGDASIGPEDVEQQAFIAFCELVEQWDAQRLPFNLFLERRLTRKLRNYVRDALHSRSRVKRVPGALADETIEVAGAVMSAESEAEVRMLEQVEWFERAASLPPDERWKELIMMRFQEGLSSRQIAVVSGRTHRTVNRNLRAAIEAIRNKIQEEWEDCG